MSKIWPSVTRQHPCPICGKTDWCAIGDRAYKCMRVESKHASKDGGWFHFFDSKVAPAPPRSAHKSKEPAKIDAEAIMSIMRAKTKNFQRVAFASSLGVDFVSLLSLEVAWSDAYSAWAFPMRDGDNRVIGIRLRSLEGKKWAVTGSRAGIFVPQHIKPETVAYQTFYVVEGPTDVAACLSMGIMALGKPSCNAGDDHVCATLKRLGVRRVVVVSDNDDPGQLGALKAMNQLKIRRAIMTLPTKDVREFYRLGGTKADIVDLESKLLWD